MVQLVEAIKANGLKQLILGRGENDHALEYELVFITSFLTELI